MESYQLRLLKRSFAELARAPELAAAYFYSELFHRSPETRAMFKEDPGLQRRTLMSAVDTAVTLAARPDLLVDHLEDIGRRQAAHGVKRAHYESAEAALMWMLEQMLGDGFTDDTRDAWELFWKRAANTMIAANEEAMAVGAANRRQALSGEAGVHGGGEGASAG